ALASNAPRVSGGGPAHAFVPGGLERLLGRSPAAAWPAYRRSVARPFAVAARALRRLGARVRPRLGPDSLAHECAAAPVVVLVSHWREPRLDAEAVLDPELILDAVAAGGDWVHERLRAAVGRECAALRAARGPGLAAAVAELLSAVLAEATRRRDARADLGPYASLTRGALEQSLAGALAEGAPLELRGGMLPARTLLAAVPPERELTLDLTLCHSVDLAERLRVERPHCRVVGRNQPERIEIGLVGIAETLRILREDGPMPYIEARTLAELARSGGGS
ncbi:MAG: hypothetical protein AAF682_20950, partial [Planctomycetota bacterium]